MLSQKKKKLPADFHEFCAQYARLNWLTWIYKGCATFITDKIS